MAEKDGSCIVLILRILDIVIKNGSASLVECLRLREICKTFDKRFSNVDEILRFVVMLHCVHTRHYWDDHTLSLKQVAYSPSSSSHIASRRKHPLHSNSPMQFRFWKACLMTKEVNRSLSETYGISILPQDSSSSSSVPFYIRLTLANVDATCSSPGQMGEIMRDVRRTFPSHPFFREGSRGNKILGRILRGNFLLIYKCNFHVLSNLLLIYICKLHWNLNTMFVYQVNHF